MNEPAGPELRGGLFVQAPRRPSQRQAPQPPDEDPSTASLPADAFVFWSSGVSGRVTPRGLRLTRTVPLDDAPSPGSGVGPARHGHSGPQRFRAAAIDVELVGADPAARLEPFGRGSPWVSYLYGSDPAAWQRRLPTFAGVRIENAYPGVDIEITEGKDGLRWTAQAGNDSALDRVRLRITGADRISVRGDDSGSGEGGDVLMAHAGNVAFAVPLLVVDATPATSARIEGNEIARPFAPRERDLSVLPHDPQWWVDLLTSRLASSARADDPWPAGSLSAALERLSAEVPLQNDDPAELHLGTLLGGALDDFATSTAPTSDGLVVAGWTWSPDFPTTPGAMDTTCDGRVCGDAFVAKLDPSGSRLSWATFLGGSEDDLIRKVVVSPAREVNIAGSSNSADFPTTPGAFSRSFAGGRDCSKLVDFDCGDAFVAELSADGAALNYATYLGGTNSEDVAGLLRLEGGELLVAGSTLSDNFPTTSGVYDRYWGGGDCSVDPGGMCPDIYITRVKGDGSGLVFSTYLGANDFDAPAGVAVDSRGQIIVAGETRSHSFPTYGNAYSKVHNDGSCLYPRGRVVCPDGFMTKLSANGARLTYGTLIGGTGEDEILALAVDADDLVYVAGATDSTDYPTTVGAFQQVHNNPLGAEGVDGFITRFASSGAALSYSTFLGGKSADWPWALAVNETGEVYVYGETHSTEFPVTTGGFDLTFGGWTDTFLIKLDKLGRRLTYGSFVGGKYDEFAHGLYLDRWGAVYLAGFTHSLDFPTSAGAFGRTFHDTSCGTAPDDYRCPEGFLVKLAVRSIPTPGGVVPTTETPGTPAPSTATKTPSPSATPSLTPPIDQPTSTPTPSATASPSPTASPSTTWSPAPPTETPDFIGTQIAATLTAAAPTGTSTPDAVQTAIAATLTALVPAPTATRTPDRVGTAVAATLTARAPTPDVIGTAVAATLTARAPVGGRKAYLPVAFQP